MLFLLGFEAAIWHFRGATTCFYWASKLPSGTFPAALLSGPSVAPQLSIGLRNCHPPSSFAMGFPRPHELFLLGFEAAIWHFRGATTSFYWASKLPSGTFPAPLKSLKTLPAALPWDFPRPLELFLLAFEAAIWPEAPQLSIRLRHCHLAFSKNPLKALQRSKLSQQLCHGTSRGPTTSCFCGLRSCYLELLRWCNLFLVGFETAIWHVSSTP